MKSSQRPAAVAGLFYPSDPGECRRQVDSLLAESSQAEITGLQALIAPHAGYIYSGTVAAAAYRALPNPGNGRPVAIFGPNHRVPLQGMALDGHGAYATPLGVVPLATPLVDTLAHMEAVSINSTAHAREHCIEVQLPFLQVLDENFQLIPVLVGDCAPGTVARAMEAMQEAGALVLVSSDLSHFLPYDEARSVDQATAEAINAGDTSLEGYQACGCRAINGLNELAGQRGWKTTVLAMGNSGDTAGDRQQVVGYGAYAYH